MSIVARIHDSVKQCPHRKCHGRTYIPFHSTLVHMSEQQHHLSAKKHRSVAGSIEHVGTAFHRADKRDTYRALPLFQDEHGECFFKLTNKDDPSYTKRRPHIQAMVTMLLKDVIPVAEVVPVRKSVIPDNPSDADMRPDYYSHLVPLDIDELGSDAIPAEVYADIFILEMLFNDTEHTVHARFPQNITVHGSHYALFDFSEAALRVNRITHADVARLKKRKGYSDAVLQIVRQRLDVLEKHIAGDAGKRLYLSMKQRLKEAGEPDSVLREIPDNGSEIVCANIQALRSVLV